MCLNRNVGNGQFIFIIGSTWVEILITTNKFMYTFQTLRLYDKKGTRSKLVPMYKSIFSTPVIFKTLKASGNKLNLLSEQASHTPDINPLYTGNP